MDSFGKYLLIYILFRSILFNLVGVFRSLMALGWKKTPAHLTYTNIDASIDIRGVRVYTVDIRYYYYLNGKMYTSKQFAFNYSNNPLVSLHKFTLWRLKNKNQVFARVNPKKPDSAVIFSGIHLFHFVNLCLPFISGPFQAVELGLIKRLLKKG